jgi:NAD(P)-dependent dehydrogenase (short-subunit alcohol dehydrogenase family)
LLNAKRKGCRRSLSSTLNTGRFVLRATLSSSFEFDAWNPTQGTAIWVPIDVTKAEDWERGIKEIEERMGPLDVVCNK